MPGTTNDVNLRSRTARAKLKTKSNEPYWTTLIVGRAALGWVRDKDKSRWLLRRYVDGRYSREFLGRADDKQPADGSLVLSFEQAEAMARTMLDSPTSVPTSLTVRAAMDRYIERQRSTGKEIRDLIYRTDAWILPTLGNWRVGDLTAARLRQWLDTIANSPAMKRAKRGQRQYRETPKGEHQIRARRATANRVLNMLRAALNFCYDEGLVKDNSAWNRRLKPFGGVDAARPDYLTIAEAKRLINAAAPDFRPLVEAALQTGCRYGELCRLRVEDFNPDAGSVFIAKSKTGRPRDVHLTPEGTAFFKQHCAGRRAGLMFAHADGRPWKPVEQVRPMAEACARAGLDVGFHALRHTWASLSVMAEMPLIVVAKNLGHSSTKMVERHYGHLAPSYITDTIRAKAPKYGVAGDSKIAALR